MIKLSVCAAIILIFTGCRDASSVLTNMSLQKSSFRVSTNIQTILTTEKWTLSDVLIVTDKNDTVRGRVRRPVNHNLTYPVAFLVVGIETGKEVVGMITGFDSVIVFSIDYPYSGSMDFSGWKGLTTILALRTVGFRSIGQILISIDWLASLPDVDTANISVIAVSFGVFTGIPAAVIDKRVTRLAVVQAGGDLNKILAANSERLNISVPPWFAAWLGGWILSPFEPNEYIGNFSPRSFLLVSGESDRLFPPESIQSLYNHARDPKEWIKHESGHVDPGMEKLITELAEIVGKKLYPQ